METLTAAQAIYADHSETINKVLISLPGVIASLVQFFNTSLGKRIAGWLYWPIGFLGLLWWCLSFLNPFGARTTRKAERVFSEAVRKMLDNLRTAAFAAGSGDTLQFGATRYRGGEVTVLEEDQNEKSRVKVPLTWSEWRAVRVGYFKRLRELQVLRKENLRCAGACGEAFLPTPTIVAPKRPHVEDQPGRVFDSKNDMTVENTPDPVTGKPRRVVIIGCGPNPDEVFNGRDKPGVTGCPKL